MVSVRTKMAVATVILVLLAMVVYVPTAKASPVSQSGTTTGTITVTAGTPAQPQVIDFSTTPPAAGGVNIWLAILISLIGGALGGAVYELISLQGNIEIPHKFSPTEEGANTTDSPAAWGNPMSMYDLGVFARVFIGAMAALAVLVVITPATPLMLLGTAILAGSAGTAVFDALKARLVATIAQARVVRTEGALNQINERMTIVQNNLSQLRPPVSVEEAVGTPRESATLPSNTQAIAEIYRALSEAQAIYKAVM